VKVRTRLLLLGVVVPAIVFAVALFVARVLFERELVASLDRELRARAAVESVGAFDHPEEHPHLHLGRATFPDGFVEIDPRGAFFSESGELVARDPEDARIEPGPHAARSVVDRPTFWTSADGARREFAVGVRGRSGRVYLLRLSCSLGPLEQTISSYTRTTTLVLAAVIVSLVLLWLALGRFLSRRLEALALKLASPSGIPEWPEPPNVRDEIDVLDKALAVAFVRLRRARDAEEQFLARAAHELRTPLGVMVAELDHALRRERGENELREALVSTRREVARLSALSTQLLDLTAAGHISGDVTEVDLGEVADDSLRGFAAPIAEKSLRVEKRFEVGVSVFANPGELRQAIDNLVANAVRHAPERSALTLTISGVGHPVLAIADEGPGIAEADKTRIFEPFFRGKGSSGSGLGLAIVRAIVERQGGTIDVRAGQGATFIVKWGRAD
jgi:signal transduction histidine kinase